MCVDDNRVTDFGFSWLRLQMSHTSCPLMDTVCLDKSFRSTAKAGLLVGHAGGKAI